MANFLEFSGETLRNFSKRSMNRTIVQITFNVHISLLNGALRDMEMCILGFVISSILFWMEYCGIWNNYILEFMN